MSEESDKNICLCIDYLHPEILSVEDLVAILKERRINIKSVDSLDKCALVEHFYKHILPLSQRSYGDGRRQKRLAKARDAKQASEIQSNEKSLKTSEKPNLVSKERPKPPPDQKSKVISLKTDTKQQREDSSKRKIQEHEPKNETKKQRHSPIIW